jgi:hypothetical protein
MAAYEGREISWEKMMKSNEKWNLKMNLDSVGTGSAITMR